ncbi:MAG: leucyl aminopeptidase [Nitrospirales bacterium]|nr:leucyl aminopeptidase [Nitrospira sp.]MDR4500760.1 leucyl aminopeptidase [Nitrospirales bacterium]
MKITVKQGTLTGLPTDVLVIPGYEGETGLGKALHPLDRNLGGQLTELRKSGEFQGKVNQTALIHTRGAIPAKRVLLVGLGKREDLTLDRVRQALGTVAKYIRQIEVLSFATSIFGIDRSGLWPDDLAQAMTEGVILGDYRFLHYRTDSAGKLKPLNSMTLLVDKTSLIETVKRGIQRGEATGEATCFARDLCNHPANVMTPLRIVEEAKKISKEKKVRLTVLNPAKMKQLGMGGVLGVGQASQHPPQFVVLEYHGGKKGEKPVVFVGKTVTFDTGGISLKPSENMEHMKADMTGGAEVLATVRAAARLKLPLNVVGLLPVAENMPGGKATKPGDILTMLSGKTVEVQNTDAEGRLILADGLAYAERLKPACVIDIATLTGACIIALGQFAIGMLGNDETLKEQLKQAGDRAGERVWEMPLWDEYFEQLKSDVADMRNIGGRGGGMITAAMFLKQFVGKFPWAHLDIASTDWSATDRPCIGKGPTATGTRLLIQFLLNMVNKPHK